MVSDEHDELIERFAARLRPLPEIDPAARARVLVAVAAERERDRERARTRRDRPRVVRWTAAAAVAAAVVLSAVLIERGGESAGTAALAPVMGPAPAPAGTTASLAARDAGAPALQQVQLVFRAPDARRVSVVGDFTGWDPSRAVMTRDSGSGLWSVTVALAPGRHVYAFLVDDSVWVRDPRAPSAPDADFGRPGSVLLVGRP